MTTAMARARFRRGSTYVLVLGLSAIIMTMALGALALARIQARQGRGTADVVHARLAASAAVEIARLIVKTDPNWRTNYPNGTWASGVPVGGGTGTLQAVDPGDGNLADDPLEAVVLTGTGARGVATQKIQVTLLAQARAYGCLQTALHAGHDVILSSCTVQCDQTLSANHNVAASSASVHAAAEAVDRVSGDTYYGTTTEGVDARSMPGAATVLSEYQGRGVAIPYSAIPWNDGMREIDEAIFSPAHNPYWPYTTDPEGIYVIQCAGNDIRIRDSRIVGTLVLMDAGANTRMEGAVHWQPAVANYPALLVDGDLTFALDGGVLDEDMENENFNPSHTPYGGEADSDQVDVYPSRIEGLVYIEHDVSVASATVTVRGTVVIGHDLKVEANGLLLFQYDPDLLNNPPPGFIERIDMIVSEGSYQRVVD